VTLCAFAGYPAGGGPPTPQGSRSYLSTTRTRQHSACGNVKSHSNVFVVRLHLEPIVKVRRRIKRRLANFLVNVLTKEHAGYTQRFPNDLRRLSKVLRPGDVVLVEGSQRVSEVIKYLTQSSWSHAALYVGDTLAKRKDAAAEELRRQYGDDADCMLVEANAESGVVAVPLAKYRSHNIRVCRPYNLRPGDLNTVLQTVIAQIGTPYNVRQVLDLLRYFFPVSLIPKRFRRAALELSGEFSRQVICSSQIAMAFQKVRYPIRPRITANGSPEPDDEKPLTPGLISRVIEGFKNNREDGSVFTPCDPRLVTPRDFDLSPYFEVVKLPGKGPREFDYKKMVWSTQPESTTGVVIPMAQPAVQAPAAASPALVVGLTKS